MTYQVGVCGHLLNSNQEGSLVDLGTKYVRLDFNWEEIEPEKGKWNFSEIDRAVSHCLQHKIKIFATLAYTPAWANGGKGRAYPADDVEDWKRFVSIMVGRFRPYILHWGIWNEPNILDFFTGTVYDYVNELLIPAYSEIVEVSPHAMIVAPDLALSQSNWVRWFDVLSNYSAFFDILSFHYYSGTAQKVMDRIRYGGWPKQLRRFDKILKYFFPSRQSVMNYQSIYKLFKPFWLTEVGWSTAHDYGEGATEEYQAKQYQQMLSILSDDYTLQRVYFYDLKDDVGADSYFGITNQIDSPKKAFFVLKEWLED